jgi:hypothetical protein
MDSKKEMKKMLPMAIVAVVALVVGYFAGAHFGSGTQQPSSTRNFGNYQQTGGAAARRSGGTAGAGFVRGNIISKTDTSITIQSPDGSSRIVLFSSSTPIMKSVAGSSTDILTGQEVTAIGTTNSDGSVTAQSIQLGQSRPQIQN